MPLHTMRRQTRVKSCQMPTWTYVHSSYTTQLVTY